MAELLSQIKKLNKNNYRPWRFKQELLDWEEFVGICFKYKNEAKYRKINSNTCREQSLQSMEQEGQNGNVYFDTKHVKFDN